MVMSPAGGRRPNIHSRRLENSQRYLIRLQEDLEIEKLRGELLKERLKETCERNNIKDVNDLNLEELYEFKSKLEALRQMIRGRALEMEASSSLMTMHSRHKTPTDPEASMPQEKKNKKKKMMTHLSCN